MGEKRARTEEADDSSPRKAPRLDLLVAAVADSGRGEAVADSGRGEAAAPEASNLKEEGAEGSSDSKRCKHVPTDLKMLRSSLSFERARRCDLCPRPIEGSSILVCLDCGRHLCTGVGALEYPYGHSRYHAKQEQHWVAALSDDPESAFCFKCDHVVAVTPDEFGSTDEFPDAIRGLSAAAEADSGSEALWPEASDFREVSDQPCNHVATDSAHMKMLRSSLSSQHGGKCELCKTFKDSSILVCLECGRQFCAGLGSVDYPFGHSRRHANLNQHWVAVLYDEPESAYCFKCEYVVCVNPDEVEMMDKVKAGGHASELLDEVHGLIRELSNVYKGYYHTIRGIPNIGNTCYMNAMVQCLLVLDKLRERMLGPDAPKGLLADVLKELFEKTSAEGDDPLDLEKLLTCVLMYDGNKFKRGFMQDSQEFLICLRNWLNEAEEKRQSGTPTVVNSMFGFELSETRTCECLSNSVTHPFFHELPLPLPPRVHLAKSAASPQISESLKSQPKKTAIQSLPANEQSTLGRNHTVAESGYSHLLGSELKDVAVEETPEPLEVDYTESQLICQSKDVVQGPFQTKEEASCSKLSQGIFDVPVKSIRFIPPKVSDVKVEEMNETEMNETTTDSIASIEECLSLFFEEVVQWRCDSCSKAITNHSKNGEQMVASTNENTTVDGDQAEQSDRTTCQNEQSSGSNSLSVECKSSSRRQPHGSDAQSQIIQTMDRIADGTNAGMSCGKKESDTCSTTNKEHEYHKGIPEAVSSCLPAEKQIKLLRDQQSEDVSIQIKMYQDRRKQTGVDHSSYQLKDNRNEQKDSNGHAMQTRLFNKLPPVLTLHLKRTNNYQRKISGHVRYKEYLDVRSLMDPSSVDKDNSIYRLVGVVEHRGTKRLDAGHYVAYVRARKVGNHQQQSSSSHSWFHANDSAISIISLEEVLKREAYVLFYERMEG